MNIAINVTTVVTDLQHFVEGIIVGFVVIFFANAVVTS